MRCNVRRALKRRAERFMGAQVEIVWEQKSLLKYTLHPARYVLLISPR
jgi:hypothetical protein